MKCSNQPKVSPDIIERTFAVAESADEMKKIVDILFTKPKSYIFLCPPRKRDPKVLIEYIMKMYGISYELARSIVEDANFDRKSAIEIGRNMTNQDEKSRNQKYSLDSSDDDFDSDFLDDDLGSEGNHFADPLKYLIRSFSDIAEEKVRDVFQKDAKSDIGVAVRLLKEISVLESIRSEFASASKEEVRLALEQAGNNKDEACKIVMLNKIENPAPEEALVAMRPDIPIKKAKKIWQAAPSKDAWDVLNLANAMMPLQPPKIKKQKMHEMVMKGPIRTKILTLDLHGYNLRTATHFVRQVLECNRNSPYGKINFITGKGIHSKGGIPVIRPMVLHQSEKMGFAARILPENHGVVQVDLNEY